MNLKLIEDYIEEHAPSGAAKLALKCGCSLGLIHKIRNGHLPNLAVAMSLAKVLDVSLEELARAHKGRKHG